eukprot:snap_masked-scaffold_9-processed-gene-7.37-mRNA-1 protein AED:1.00 eAED:1.00 QI:0/0/0/0/1/1/2/0/88
MLDHSFQTTKKVFHGESNAADLLFNYVFKLRVQLSFMNRKSLLVYSDSVHQQSIKAPCIHVTFDITWIRSFFLKVKRGCKEEKHLTLV